jgi:hypothetical protein
MSGIILATIGKVAPPPSPLSIHAQVQGGSVPVHVAGASGNTQALPGGGFRTFAAGANGGTPPYSYRWERENGTNKTSLVNGSSATAYVSWSGMIVGEYQSTTTRCTVRDSNGKEATSNLIVIGVTRDS